MSSPLNTYLSQISQAIYTENGATLAALTNPQFPQDWLAQVQPELQKLSHLQANGQDDPFPELVARAGINDPYTEFVIAFLKYLDVRDQRDLYDNAGAVFAHSTRDVDSDALGYVTPSPENSGDWDEPENRTFIKSAHFMRVEKECGAGQAMYLSAGLQGSQFVVVNYLPVQWTHSTFTPSAFTRSSFPYRQWHAPILKTLCEGLIRLALDRDAFLSKKLGNRKTTAFNLQNRFSVLMSHILADKQGVDERKSAALLVTNIALRFYVRIDEWQLCNKLHGQIERGRLDLTQYPKSQRVTYHFMIGRLKLFYHAFKAAEKHFAFALQHCHKDAIANRQRIFPLMIATRLVRGMLPSDHLLQKYNLTAQFAPLIYAFRKGHFAQYHAAVEAHASYFASLNVLYILQYRTTALLYRNLFRTVYLISDQSGGAKPLEYDALLRAARFVGAPDIDMNGIESVITLLIAHGYLKGYTLPGRGKVVLSKTNPFPHPYEAAQARASGSAAAAAVKARPKPMRRTSALPSPAANMMSFGNTAIGHHPVGTPHHFLPVARRPSRRI
ncbi:hypothetical protein DFJ77DRAFT_437732 [Powellomyces hirtus]|nr:hypothetical protein DFJ77DRAFT_437732 [Powellomyces hirtus]